MNPIEVRAATSLASVFVLRMLGLFMIMPVIAIYASDLQGVSPMWIGLAIGAYGLTQAALQIPAGLLSDKIGRKPVMVAGLLLFALGSVIAGSSDSIYGVVIGRAIQGCGAIAAAILALAGDLSRESQRTKVMAIIGISIGMSFAISMIVGPLLAANFGLSGLFYTIAAMAIAAIAVVCWWVPKEPKQHKASKVKQGTLGDVLKNRSLLKLDYGVFVIHLMMTALFITLPLQLVDHGLIPDHHWFFYLPVFFCALAVLGPLMKMAKKNQNKANQIALIMLLIGLVILLFNPSSIWLLGVAGWFYFSGFNYLEASMPSLLTKLAPVGAKGRASGVYSTSQFIGAFLGG
ncbi:MFS transporter [Vibrio sp. SS-MA-C1-2]|uniref:MFS transporter n=1 Tax=Vibrio sp. SS-MA-C1-2 TaxID=2908646 RepID=UPI001F300738|nr:MFS transporter [Vibrio sp. SS-MA-C1-2]UJF19155.1 MFS transporter [Vibrio sp. SS-MA-C1-2]